MTWLPSILFDRYAMTNWILENGWSFGTQIWRIAQVPRIFVRLHWFSQYRTRSKNSLVGKSSVQSAHSLKCVQKSAD